MTRRHFLSAFLFAMFLRRPSRGKWFAKTPITPACGSGAWLLVVGNPPYGATP